MTTKEQINQFLTDDNVLFIYEFESTIKKQFIVDSDSEYIIVHKENIDFCESYTNIEVYSIQQWFKAIEDGELNTFKCNALKSKYILKEYISMMPKLNMLNIRAEIDNKCTIAQAFSKFDFECGNYASGKILLYQSFQYVLWGLQIMINKKIIHLDIPDEYFIDIILNPNNDYKYYEEKYLNKLDKLLNEFKSYSENEFQEYKRKRIIENGNK